MAKDKCSTSNCDDLFKGRRSIRAYEDKPVPREMIEHLIKCAAQAPSTLNAQPWHFTVIQGERKEAILGLLRRSSLYLEDQLAILDAKGREDFEQHATEEERQRFMTFYDSLGHAPAIIVITTRKLDIDVMRRMALISCAAAAENLMLAASCYGLGTCCVGSGLWTEEELLQQLDISDSELVATIAIGYPAETPEPVWRDEPTINWIGP